MTPSLYPSAVPTTSPTNDYIYYELMINLTANNSNKNDTFYVRLKGTTTSSTEYQTEWEKIVIGDDNNDINNEYYFLFYWLNVDRPDTLTILTYNSNNITFDCFGINMMSDNSNYNIFNTSEFEFICSDTDDGYVCVCF